MLRRVGGMVLLGYPVTGFFAAPPILGDDGKIPKIMPKNTMVASFVSCCDRTAQQRETGK